VLGSLRNLFLNDVRRKGREVLESDYARGRGLLEDAVAPGSDRDSPEEVLLHTVRHGEVDRALRGLPLPFREAVVLADLEGLSYREIADVMRCPVGTVMSRLSRGRQLLRQGLGRFAREHGYSKEP
jgi:RNA polymerase sigma-70 factor (ECF subfamily)